MTLQNKRRSVILLVASLLLLIPFIAMQFSSEVNWSFSDFVIAAILLFGTGLVCDWILTKVKTAKYRLLLFTGVLLVLALLWIELAVGIFGSPFAGS